MFFYAGFNTPAVLIDKDKTTVLEEFGCRNAARKKRRTDQGIAGLMVAKSSKNIELLTERAEIFENGRYVKIMGGTVYKILDREDGPVDEFNPCGLQFVTLSLE